MNSPGHRTISASTLSRFLLAPYTILVIVAVLMAAKACLWPIGGSADSSNQAAALRPRFAGHASVRPSGPLSQAISLNLGHDFLAGYSGPSAFVDALAQNKAEALSLASADFDEDGTPDLVAGYDYRAHGLVSLYRGNPDSIYPNAPEAQARRARGEFSNTPFLSPATVFDAPVVPDFLAAGDFDADGHWDLVIANRDEGSLVLLAGDGRGTLNATAQLRMQGRITAMTTGEINRRDGLTDIIVGTDGTNGPKICVFEGPLGALRAEPEIFEAPAVVTSLALGQLDHNYEMDLAVAAGDSLLIVHGRDRKLTLRAEERATVAPAPVSTRSFPYALRSLAIGDFKGGGFSDVAVLGDRGQLELITQPRLSGAERNRIRNIAKRRGDRSDSNSSDTGVPLGTTKEIAEWPSDLISDSQTAIGLLTVRVSSAATDDLIVLDSANKALHVMITDRGNQGGGQPSPVSATPGGLGSASFGVESAPVAVLPMRLDQDALDDLVVIRDGAVTPVIMQTTAIQVRPPGYSPDFVSFSNTAPITMSSGSFANPPRLANPYPSTISVSGVSGTIDKLRVRLNNLSFGSFQQDLDLVLVGPGGQKVMLMSDVGNSCVITNQTFTFDDEATLDLIGACSTGTYKPTDNPPADTFPPPGPTGPYQTTLATFNGTDPNGTWSLFMVDDASFFGSGQSIAGGWTLFFGPDSPSNFVVINTNTSGPGSLAQAIIDANGHLGVDNIVFNIPGGGPFTIDSAPPTVTEPVTIDATTQPGFAGKPIIELHGGFFLTGGRATVRGFVINNTTGSGFLIRQNGNNIIEGNYIGTNLAGTAAQGAQGGNGVEIDTANNVVGGTTAAARNVIGNKTHGVMLATFNDSPTSTADDASDNVIQGNYIGLNADGTAIIPNSHAGVTSRSAPGSPNNTVGGTTAGARNVISGGSFPSGVDLVYSGSHGWLVQGNFIGTDATGTQAFGSGTFHSGNNEGVNLEGGAFDNTIGGTSPAARNLISGNSNGLFLRDGATTGNLIQGNFIGTDATGTQALSNTVGLRMIFDAAGNTVGGAVDAARNIISGNVISGIQLGEPTKGGALNDVFQRNFIGTDVTGDSPLGNGRTPFFDDAGIIIPANARGDRIIENRIAYNNGHGIRITNVSGGDIDSIEIEITDNLIYGNQGLGIDLGPSGITANDPQDADGGPNLLQNFPVLTSFAPAPPPAADVTAEALRPNRPDVTVNVNGTLNSTPNQTFTVQWYFSADTQCSSNQEATRPLAFGRVPNVTTDASGNASFSFPFAFPVGVNSGVMNCTAKDAQGNTSEFSACFPLTSTTPASVKFSAANYNIGEGGASVTCTVMRSGDTTGASTVDFVASDGSATQNQDYVVTSGTLNFAAGETSKTFDVLIVNDAFVEGAEAINLTLSNVTGGTLGTPGTATITISDNDSAGSTSPAAKRFAAMLDGAQETPANNSQGKGTGYVLLNQSETAASVSLQFQNLGSAETAAHIHGPGAAGVSAPILFTLPTTNPVTNHQISPTAQEVADLKAGLHYLNVHSNSFPLGEIRGQLRWNPTMEENFFVRQQYLDFLSRDGDPGGFNFWVNQVASCQADAQCLHDRTITTSNAFFFEPEFQQTAGYVFRAYRAAFGNNQPFPNPDGSNATEANKLIDYATFVSDRSRVVGGADLAAAQQAFANQFVLRSAFTTKYAAATTAAQFVDAILANIQSADGVNLTGQRQALISQYNNAGGGNAGRAMVLYRLADDNAQNPINNQAFINAEYNRQFALTLYFGYLRRNPDIGGFLFWQSQINLAPVRDVPKQNALVCSFLTAAEYQLRFGPNAPRSNAECPQ